MKSLSRPASPIAASFWAHEGYKPLHVAASENRPEVVKVLLAAGVNPLTPKTKEAPGMFCGNAPSSWGDTPLMYACNNGHTKAAAEFLPYLTDPDSITKALFWSAGSGHAACVGLILQHATVDVNAKYMGETLLFKAGKCAGTAKRLAAMSVISTARLRSSIEPIPKVA